MSTRMFLQVPVPTPPVDILDSLIYATIVLFILSIITEKLTQLVRYYPRTFRWIGIVCCTAFYFPILRATYWPPQLTAFSIAMLLLINTALLVVLLANDPIADRAKSNALLWLLHKLEMFKNVRKARAAHPSVPPVNAAEQEKEVTALSFLIGFLVAYCFNASLFVLFRPAFTIGWGDVAPFAADPWYALNPAYFNTGVATGIGFLLTAFFLAFGSKFFHDLLDTLLQAKDLKRKLNDKETYNIESVAELQEQLKYTQGEFVRLAISQNKAVLEKLPNFVSLHEGLDVPTDTVVACLNLRDNNTTGIPAALTYTLPDKKPRTVPLKIFTNVKIASVTHGKIFNESNPASIGSVGVPLQDHSRNTLWLLTCDHVLTSGDFDEQTQTGFFQSPGRVQFMQGGERRGGAWWYGYQDNEFDIALVKPDQPDVPPSGLVQQPLDISRQRVGVKVAFKGAVSEGDGIVFAQEVDEPIQFANKVVRMRGLLKICAASGLGSIARSGDSGAVLYTNDNRAVGMIVASSDQFTYAMSLEKILSGWNAHIY